MIRIIKGARDSGKTRLAKSIMKDANVVVPTGGCFCLSEVDADTDFIFIDDRDHLLKHMSIDAPRMMVDRQGKFPLLVDTPDVIIISEMLDESDFPNSEVEIIHTSKE